jgi:transcriptional regulator with XRE-family HTH domain
MLTTTNRQQIAEALKVYLAAKNLSERKFADLIKISSSYVNSITNGTYNAFKVGSRTIKIEDKYFVAIAQQINYYYRATYWQHFDSDNFLAVSKACNKARRKKARVGIDGNTGDGKTYALREYIKQNPNETFLLTADGLMNPKDFIVTLAETVGAETAGSRHTILKAIIYKLRTYGKPLLIIDETENVKKEATLQTIKALCDALENKCGIVLAGIDLRAEFTRMASRRKYCYPQINRRFAGSWYTMFSLSEDEITNVAQTLGVKDRTAINYLNKNVHNWGELQHVLTEALEESMETKRPVTADLLRILND